MAIKFTRKAYLEVWRDNTYISRHRSLIEAGESASRHADEEGSGDYYITIGGPPQSFTELGPNGLPHNVPAGKVYYMARADVTIRFSEGAPINAFPAGAESAAETSAVSAGTSSSLDIEAPVSGADVFANAGGTVWPSEGVEDNWQTRIAGPGVVWYHDFSNEAEVDLFRWSGGLGNDPDDVAYGVGGKYESQNSVNWDTSDGVTGSACLQLLRYTGTREPGAWWRPFSPLSNNGKGVADPAANGTITLEPWSPTSGSSTTNSHEPGYYGNSTYHASYPGKFDGTGYYLQSRVKIDPRRLPQSPDGGKLFFFSTTPTSNPGQEIVVMSRQDGNVPGSPVNIFDMYRSNSPPLSNDYSDGTDDQPGSHYGYCQWDLTATANGCWTWPENEWVTVMWHIVPGLDSGGDTIVQVWAAKAGETTWTNIWDQPDVSLPYDALTPLSQPFPKGHNAVICDAYTNGFSMTEFWQKYDQLILSQEFIECPVTPPSYFVNQTEKTWQAIGNTLFDISPCPADNCSYSGGGHANRVASWCGAVASNSSLIIGPAGGHEAYDGNEVTEFNFLAESPVWEQKIAPSPVSATTVPYYPDGTPAVRHSYSQECFIPAHIKNGNRWFSPIMTAAHDNSNGFNSPSSFNLSTNQYDPEGFWPTAPITMSNQAQAVVVWDEVREVIWYRAAMNAVTGGLAYLDPATKTWSSEFGNTVVSGTNDTEVIAACDPHRGILLCYDSNQFLVAFDLETPTGLQINIPTIGTPCPGTEPGMVYDPISEAFIFWGGSGATLYKLTPASSWRTGTWTWTTIVNNGGGDIPTTAPFQGTYGRFNYISSLHALCVVNSTTEKMYIYKLPRGPL